uniref:60S ribosomal protein L36 n=1 Tax=Aegilops tauschii subsp. strangulata TaxID=200361 RepID=A0A453FWD9_AEGTS
VLVPLRPSQVSRRPAMAPSQPKSGLFVGINKGHVVTKRELPPRPSDRKGVSSQEGAVCPELD